MASNAAASTEDSTRSSTAQARLGERAASGCPKAITPLRTPTPRTKVRRSAFCGESECVARVFTSCSPRGMGHAMDKTTAAPALPQRRHRVARTVARICFKELLDSTHSEQEPAVQRTRLGALIE